MAKKVRVGGQRSIDLSRSDFVGATAIDAISLRGFKSHRDTTDLALRPLTVLAGENSGGKSSIVQPLLLMKQTLETRFDPGVLDLRGTCVKFDRAVDMFWRGESAQEQVRQTWSVRFVIRGASLEVVYRHDDSAKGGVLLDETRIVTPAAKTVVLDEGMTPAAAMSAYLELADAGVLLPEFIERDPRYACRVVPGRCAHEFEVFQARDDPRRPSPVFSDSVIPASVLERMIHLPGLRGNPERAYPVTRVSGRYPGLFQDYTASILEEWQENGSLELQGVIEDLASLRLTGHIQTSRVDDTRVEVKLGRRLDSGGHDVVNIADVGFGASQALPVVVALRAAGPDQLVHIEQPELHLHPNAQVAMAGLLIAAAGRGARLIVETHSSVLLKAIQLAVAEDAGGQLQKDIALHWFERDGSGASVVRTADLAADGSFGDWPVDFAEVEMDVHRRFIQASGRRRRGST